ncbi:hypothetical protein O7627_14080 [Solwaraspora sp. WMMD1047]|uniref:hypothetical protein n=1 Tax=Solwaraspora sp. WMMD1047 TaxID=3016102 RepID=UPI002415F582|nr:hypothetical protein [Solwaraspora sp. WMMD1047]MDG4830429.1 hypothetical protein [Solwaraspora sp. WMMD1047]
MSDLTPPNLNPFRAAPDPDAPDDRSPTADLSQAGMSRLRSPFSLDSDPGDHPRSPTPAS